MSRRAQKKVSTFTSGIWSLTSSTTFIYDGWNLVKEVKYPEPRTLTPEPCFYVWGLDLSGSLQGAGGIGGLLARVKDGTVQNYTYDGNGNVSELVDASGNVVSHYEYDPYGNLIAGSGDNPFRFSTKYLDAETGLYYYGYRYYSPVLGRWLNRDPMNESGGLNIYAFVNNNSPNVVDALGLWGIMPWFDARHQTITEQAFDAIKNEIFKDASAQVLGFIRGKVAFGSVDQDISHSNDQRRHFTIEHPENPTILQKTNYIRTYLEYLSAELNNFNNYFTPEVPTISQCENALVSFGLISHTWQDYFGHGINPNETWTTTGFIGTPDEPRLLPSTFSIWPNATTEHPPFIKGEPPLEEGEKWKRYAASMSFTAEKLEIYMPGWWKKCKCQVESSIKINNFGKNLQLGFSGL